MALSLVEMFARIDDPRNRKGKVYDLVLMLRVKDVTFEEDPCWVREGGSAQVPSALHNVATHLLWDFDMVNMRVATQYLQVHPEEAIHLITKPECDTCSSPGDYPLSFCPQVRYE